MPLGDGGMKHTPCCIPIPEQSAGNALMDIHFPEKALRVYALDMKR
jgi:hypothetical protein